MARAVAKCTCSVCGKTFERTRICASRKEADYWEERATKGIQVCPECEEKERAERAAKLREQAIADGMVDLKGSPKQLVWAEEIRAKFLEIAGRQWEKLAGNIESAEKQGKDTEKMNVGLKRFEMTEKYMLTKISAAHWWIEERKELNPINENYVIYAMEDVYTSHSLEIDNLDAPKKEEKKEKEVETLNPKEQIYGTAVIKVTEDHVSAYYPAKEDSFRDAVKSVGFYWDSDKRGWYILKKATTGIMEDRAAEVITVLLNAGFAVQCNSEVAKEKALTGDYEPYCHKWFARCGFPKYDGWLTLYLFKIPYPERNDIYTAARKIKGSVYVDKQIVIPIAQYREVEDFAQIHGFKLTEIAQEEIKKYRENSEKIVAPQKVEKEQKDVLKEILKSSDEVLPDLVDEE